MLDVVHPYQMTKPVQSSFTERVRYALLSSSLFVTLSFQNTTNMLLGHDPGQLYHYDSTINRALSVLLVLASKCSVLTRGS